MSNDLEQIVDFCILLDKEKFIQRRTYLSDATRLENDAEHSWHLAMMALLLSDYSSEKIDLLKVVSILLVHDIVEIYAGDTFAYDQEAILTQRQREIESADKLFSQLPLRLSEKLRSLWDEFEEWSTPEAKFAHTLDNFQPLMLQHVSDGKSWREGGRKLSEVLNRNKRSPEGSDLLWKFALDHFINPQILKGNLLNDNI